MPLGSLNPTPDPRPKRLRQFGLFGLAIAAALGAGWWWGQRQPSKAAANAQQKTLERSSEKLETKLAAGTASDEEQRQLLRLRLAMGDRTGAIKLLEPLSDQNPEQPSLRLLLADLKSQNDDNAGAEREIRQVKWAAPASPGIAGLRPLATQARPQGRGDAAPRRPLKPPRANPKPSHWPAVGRRAAEQWPER